VGGNYEQKLTCVVSVAAGLSYRAAGGASMLHLGCLNRLAPLEKEKKEDNLLSAQSDPCWSGRFQEEGFSQFATEFLFRLLATIFPLALEDFTGRRKLFPHPGESRRRSSGLLRHNGQWRVLSAQLSSAKAEPS
jgi:hypothetical protein